ncbi:MAG: glycosyltransferase [Chloroflexi bacterium]|nr:glycosyltransferase [Ktedonobacteraceae bacterium]MBV9708115.1 glycosyltransferase [Chloroflexota bacterium]
MRIMIVTDQYPPMIGGVPTVTHGLAVDLVKRGHQVWVLAPSYGPHNVHRLEQGVRVYRFSSFEWPTHEGVRIAFLPFVAMRHLLKKSDPHIIHIHSPIILGNIAQILAEGERKPVIVTNHYLPINVSRTLARDPLLGKPFSDVTYSYLVHFCNRCEYVTAPTQTALDLLYEHGLHVPARAISNGINLQKFSQGERDPDIRRRFNLPEDRPLALHVNRLSEEKRNDVLLDAAAKMQGNGHIALVGTGPAETELRTQAERLNLGDRVSFLGFVPDADLLALRRSCEAFVIPSQAELQSLSTMEAMACGLPVIAADAYALPELVHHGKNGFLFQGGNSDELAHYLDVLLADAELRACMGAESLKIIATHDRVQVVDEWEALYQRLDSEFSEVKERRMQMRMRRVHSSYTPTKALRLASQRTGDLVLSQKLVSRTMRRTYEESSQSERITSSDDAKAVQSRARYPNATE